MNDVIRCPFCQRLLRPQFGLLPTHQDTAGIDCVGSLITIDAATRFAQRSSGAR